MKFIVWILTEISFRLLAFTFGLLIAFALLIHPNLVIKSAEDFFYNRARTGE